MAITTGLGFFYRLKKADSIASNLQMDVHGIMSSLLDMFIKIRKKNHNSSLDSIGVKALGWYQMIWVGNREYKIKHLIL